MTAARKSGDGASRQGSNGDNRSGATGQRRTLTSRRSARRGYVSDRPQDRASTAAPEAHGSTATALTETASSAAAQVTQLDARLDCGSMLGQRGKQYE